MDAIETSSSLMSSGKSAHLPSVASQKLRDSLLQTVFARKLWSPKPTSDFLESTAESAQIVNQALQVDFR